MIRHATPADLPAIAALHLASWQDAYRGLLPDAYLDGPLPAEMAERWRALPDPALVLVAQDGFACCLLGRPVSYLDNLHARPGARRGGTGRRLMARLSAELVSRGEAALALTVIDANARARAFYSAMGGVEGEPYDEVIGGAAVPIREVIWDAAALRALAALDAPDRPA